MNINNSKADFDCCITIFLLQVEQFYIQFLLFKVVHVFSSCTEPSAALNHHGGLKFHEVFQLKQGRYADLPAAKISEMMKPNSLDVSY